jgi:hypothetical protein
MAARVAGGRRVVKKHPTRKNKGNGIASKVQSDTKKKLKDKMNKRTGGLSKPQTSSVLPSMQKQKNGNQSKTTQNGDGDEAKGDETYSMGYTYTTTVTDARVQAISGKHKALLAKRPGNEKK